MTDFEYGEAVGEEHPSRGAFVVSLVNWAGALVSVALIAGLAVWGYKLWVRDVSGVPVVRALEGPMRIAPENPGGIAAEHQGLAVNNIAAEGVAAPPPDRLVLAPRPVMLTGEDQSPAEQQAEQQAALAEEQAAAEEAEVEEAADAIELALAEAMGLSAEAGEVAPQEVETLVTASVEVSGEEPAPQAETTTAETSTDADAGGLAQSLRPMARPDRAAAPASDGAGQVASAASTGDIQTVDPAAIPVGTRLAQLGAFDSIPVAEAEWTTLSEQFADVMDGKGRVIQEAQSGGKTFYRLRVAGFDDINDARRFCSVLLAAGASCIPVITR